MRLGAFPERNSIMKTMITRCYCNTDLCVDLKTVLRNDRIAKMHEDYQGMLTHDAEYHYTFREALPPKVYQRNDRVYDGKYITITQRKDGTLQPNFKPLRKDKDFSPVAYAKDVANELLWAFESLLEKEVSEK